MRNHSEGSPWGLICVGVLFILAAFWSICAGKLSHSVTHRGGFQENVVIDRDANPLPFWFHNLLGLLVGIGLLLYGIELLLTP